MARYFIDTYDGKQHLRDEDGNEFSGTREACDAAIRLLPDMARHVLRDNGECFITTVRDEANQPILRATLSLKVEWLVRPPDVGQAPERRDQAGDGATTFAERSKR